MNGQSVNISQAATELTNMAIGEFKIINTDVRYGPPIHKGVRANVKVVRLKGIAMMGIKPHW